MVKSRNREARKMRRAERKKARDFAARESVEAHRRAKIEKRMTGKIAGQRANLAEMRARAEHRAEFELVIESHMRSITKE